MRLALLSAVVILLTACSSGSEPDTTPTTAAAGTPSPSPSKTGSAPHPSGPDCDTIWRSGQKLPRDYESCIVDGQPADQEVVECLDGSSLVVYRDEFYALTGTPIVKPDVAPLQDTQEYTSAYTSCTGE